jgi:hypothetical protein
VALILNVHTGSVVFLDWGCRHGHKMPSHPDASVLVIVERPCAAHLKDGRPQLRYLDPFDSASPFTRDRSEESELS